MDRPMEVSEYREFLIKSLLDRYIKYTMKLSNEDMEKIVKADKITFIETLEA